MKIAVNTTLSCKSCGSSSLLTLLAETCLSFPGLNGRNADPILVFPTVVVCAKCGVLESHLSDSELKQVNENAAKLGIGSV